MSGKGRREAGFGSRVPIEEHRGSVRATPRPFHHGVALTGVRIS